MNRLTSQTGQGLQDAESLARLWPRVGMLATLLVPALVLTVYLVGLQRRGIQGAPVARAALPGVIMQADRVWTSVDLIMTQREMEVLETRDYVFRTYRDNVGTPVDLCIVFSEDNRKGTHPPDVCLEGNGSRIVGHYARNVTPLAGVVLPVREIVARGPGGGYQYYLYFYKVGDSFTPSFYEQQGKILWYGMTGRDSGGALIRYSTAMRDVQDLEGARKRVEELLGATFEDIRAKLSTR